MARNLSSLLFKLQRYSVQCLNTCSIQSKMMPFKHKLHNRHPIRQFSSLTFTEDRYNGIHVDLEQLNNLTNVTPLEFQHYLEENVPKWKKEKATSIWLKFPIEQCGLVPIAAKFGFSFHHAEGQYSMMFLWLGTDSTKSRLPRFATHQVGVSGCVLRPETREILVVRDKNRPFTMWKFPGGLAELGEDIQSTAEREVYEETGINSDFQGVLTFRQQHNQPGAFGRSDFYFICLMKPTSYKINACSHEIEACQWMKVEELAGSAQNSAITLRVLQLINLGLDIGFDNVLLVAESFKSVYKGMEYKLYNRTLPKELEFTQYMHDVANYNDRNKS